MDKNTLIAVVLSVVVISVGFFIQAMLSAPDEEELARQKALQSATEEQKIETEESQFAEAEEAERRTFRGDEVTSGGVVPIVLEGEAEPIRQEIKGGTDYFDITFSTVGGTIQSLKLKEHLDENYPVEMLYTGESGRDAFTVTFGDDRKEYADTLYHFSKPDEYTYEFYRWFTPASGGNGKNKTPFLITKTYRFKPGEYLFELNITIENKINEIPNLDFNGSSYTLYVGPQIGPSFEKLDPRKREFRDFFIYTNGKRDKVKMSREGIAEVDERSLWGGIAGKYFTLIAIPDATQYDILFKQRGDVEGLPLSAEMLFSRPQLQSSKNTDVFYFYAGPKRRDFLDRYNQMDNNGFQLKGLNLDAMADSTRIFGWLEKILKFFLVNFYKIIPNYGVAIILLTVLVKLILFPFTRKSYESSSKMQQLSPKINELREKHKDNPQKMNQEMAAIYKKEGVSPLGGCLPMLLQLPVFIALYGLLTSHFDLRGAVFIPPWITDLSAPESIWNFAPFQLPILGWSDLRLLPIIFVGTQLLSSKMMQSPSTGSQGNMKIMMYALPVVFFFILYDVPSGLLVYWIVTNVLTVLQQRYIAKIKKKKKA